MKRPTNLAPDAKLHTCRQAIDGIHIARAGADVLNHERRRVAVELLRNAGMGVIEVRLQTFIEQNPHAEHLDDIERDIVRRGGAVVTGWAVTA